MTDLKGMAGREWANSISDPLLGKIAHFLHLCGVESAMKNFRPKNILKGLKYTILGHFDKWPSFNFEKSIREQALGHPPQFDLW